MFSFPTKAVLKKGLLIGVSVLLLGGTGYAQNVTTATSGVSKTKLDDALTPKTRQTLQDAMDAMAAQASAPAEKEASVKPGEALVMDGTKVEHIPYETLPAPVKDALSGGVRQTLSTSGK